MMPSYSSQAPVILCENNSFGESVSEVEAEPIPHLPAQGSKHREIWNISMGEEMDGLKSKGTFAKCELPPGRKAAVATRV